MNLRSCQGAVMAALTLTAVPVLAQHPEGWQMPMHRWGWGMGWLWMLLAIAFWILVFIALVYLVKYLVQATTRGEGRPETGRSTALDILKERYARGEIDREEFLSRKQDLLE